MSKTNLYIVKTLPNSNAFQCLARFETEINLVETSESLVETYEIKTAHDIDLLLDASDGVIEYSEGPVELCPTQLKVRLQPNEFDELIRRLNEKGHNVKRGAAAVVSLRSASMRQLEDDCWYEALKMTWERQAAILEEEGWTRDDSRPSLTIFHKGESRCYLARRLGKTRWFRTADHLPPA